MRWYWGAWHLAALLVLAASPVASAAEGSGIFTTDGSATLPPEGEITLAPLAVLLNDTAPLAHFVLEAPVLDVRIYEYRFVRAEGDSASFDVPLNPVTLKESRATFLNARVHLVGDGTHDGFAGVYPATGSELTLVPETPIVIEPRDVSTLRTADASAGVGSEQEWAAYDERVSGRHVSTAVPGDVLYVGAGAVKLFGPDVRITSSENTSKHRTGEYQDSAHSFARVWIHMQFDGGELRLSTPQAPVEVAAEAVTRASWSGEVGFTPTSGVLETRHMYYRPPGGPISLTGTFTGALTPLEQGDAMIFRLRGNVEETTLTPEPVPLVTRMSAAPTDTFLLFLGGTLLVAAIGIAGNAAIVRWKGRGSPGKEVGDPAAGAARVADSGTRDLLSFDDVPAPGRSSLAECVARARHAARLGEWETALEWTRAAQRLAPADAHFCLMEGDYLRRLGRQEDARVVYEAAARLKDDGHADYRLAVFHADRASAEAATAHLARALRRNPGLVGTAAADPALKAIRHHPAAKRACEEARLRLRHLKE